MANGRNEGSRARDAQQTAAPEHLFGAGGGVRRGARRLSAPPPSSSGLGGASLPVPLFGPGGGRRADGPAPRAPAVAELHERLDQERG